MTKEQLKDIIYDQTKKLGENETNRKQIEERLSKLADENGRISNTDLSLFVFAESIAYSRNLMYSVLCEVLPIDE